MRSSPNAGRGGAFCRGGAVVVILALLAAACSPRVDYRGYLPRKQDMDKIQVGLSKSEVEAALGTPSTRATINREGDSYYYISSVVHQAAFFKPEEVDRQVFAVRFDASDRVASFAHYGLEDGQIVNFSSNQTPTRGKELTVLQQIFSNLGRFDPGAKDVRGPGGSIGRPGI
jgi:outer membrane protein assembly factor BamE (lipoprotein component of BamABCDE complex)